MRFRRLNMECTRTKTEASIVVTRGKVSPVRAAPTEALPGSNSFRTASLESATSIAF